jgi:hypothetical protein
MGDPLLITFSYKELATVLIKHQGLHEGLWNVFVQPGLLPGHIKTGPSEEDVVPGVIVPLVKIGLQKQDKATPLSVDAAEVNPPPKP